MTRRLVDRLAKLSSLPLLDRARRQGNLRALRPVAWIGTTLAIVAAWGVQAAIGHQFGDVFAFAPFLVATLVAAWLGGIWPAVYALIAGYVISSYFYVSSSGLIVSGSDELAAVSLYLLFGFSAAFLAESLHEARRSAQSAHQRLRTTLDSIDEAVIAADSQRRVTLINAQAERLTGYSQRDALGASLDEVLKLRDERTSRAVPPAAPESEGSQSTFLLAARGGEERPVRLSVAPIPSVDGEAGGIVCVFRDASDDRRAQLSLETLASIVRSSDDAIISLDLEGVIQSWNGGAERLFGYREFEAVGKPMEIIIPEEKREAFQSTLNEIRQGRMIEHLETVRRRKDGRRVHVSVSTSPLLDSEGAVRGASKIAHDITELRQEQTRQRLLADVSQALSNVVDYQGAMEILAQHAVESFADVCVVTYTTGDGGSRRVSAADSQPRSRRVLEALEAKDPPEGECFAAMRRMLRGEPGECDGGGAHDTDADPNQVKLHTQSEGDVESYVCVPLGVRGRFMGRLLLATCGRAQPFERRDVEVALDVARRASAAIENALLYDDLKEASRQKDDFLAMLAHELRNPLAALQYANEISKTPGVMEPSEVVQIVDRQVATLRRLIDDLLDVSRITRYTIQLQRESVQGGAIARRALATVRPLLDERRHHVEVEIDDQGMPLLVDPTRVEQVLVNLLSNAAKYTPAEGRIRLSAQREAGEAVFRVSDSGIGIPPEMLSRVFELFVQVGRSADRGHGGLGIGLTVVRKLVELHGGAVTANSEGLGRGSQFTVRLPLSDRQPIVPGGNGQPRPHRALRVLIVDDQEAITRGVAAILRHAGHSVRIAHNAWEALREAESWQPEAFLLDIGLPGMDGYALLDALRERGFPSAVFLAMSGYGQPRDFERSRAAGFDRHLVKPVPAEELMDSLAELAANRG